MKPLVSEPATSQTLRQVYSCSRKSALCPRETAVSDQPEGSHVHWPRGYDEVSSADDAAMANIHRMSGDTGPSSSWSVRLPNDRFVRSEAVTLEEMRAEGAV